VDLGKTGVGSLKCLGVVDLLMGLRFLQERYIVAGGGGCTKGALRLELVHFLAVGEEKSEHTHVWEFVERFGKLHDSGGGEKGVVFLLGWISAGNLPSGPLEPQPGRNTQQKPLMLMKRKEKRAGGRRGGVTGSA